MGGRIHVTYAPAVESSNEVTNLIVQSCSSYQIRRQGYKSHIQPMHLLQPLHYDELIRSIPLHALYLQPVLSLSVYIFPLVTRKLSYSKMGQPQIPPTPPGTSLAGKTIIITGGNAGMGFEAARQFLTLKTSTVIIAVRSKTKGQEAVSALRTDLEVKKVNPDATIRAFELDLDDYESGLAFARKVKAEVKELDILLCNGGVNIMSYQKSKSGHERVMQGTNL